MHLFYLLGAALRRESRIEQASTIGTPSSSSRDEKNSNSLNNNNNNLVVSVQLESSGLDQMTEVERSLRSRMAKRDGLMK